MNIDQIITQAKDILLETGDFPPCVFVELDRTDFICVGLPQSEIMPDALERARLNFFAGRAFAQKTGKKYKKQKVTGVCSIAKVWYTITEAGKGTPYVRPSRSPHRKEGFNIAILDADTMEQKQMLYEILRDGSGALVDLFRDPMSTAPKVVVHSAGLPCFVTGIRTAEQHQSQAIHEFRRMYERYAPPPQRFI